MFRLLAPILRLTGPETSGRTSIPQLRYFHLKYCCKKIAINENGKPATFGRRRLAEGDARNHKQKIPRFAGGFVIVHKTGPETTGRTSIPQLRYFHLKYCCKKKVQSMRTGNQKPSVAVGLQKAMPETRNKKSPAFTGGFVIVHRPTASSNFLITSIKNIIDY
jgi:hypothetical protein